jgi:membrane fusion protein, multidrug efflux system
MARSMRDELRAADREGPTALSAPDGGLSTHAKSRQDVARAPKAKQPQTAREPAVPQDATAAAPSLARRHRLRRALLALGPLLVLVVGGYLWLTGGRYVGTDNAYLKADRVAICAQVSGPIAAVAVVENQHVAKGDLLFRLDPTPFEVALRKAEAELAKVGSDIAALKASYQAKTEELELAHSNLAFAQREFERQSALRERKVASAAQLDRAQHDFDVAQQHLAMLRQDQARLLAGLNGDPDIPLQEHPSWRAAGAARDAAALDLAHATVTAPFAGSVSNKPEPGHYVSAGVPVLSIVADDGVWIEANFKETDLTNVRPGQSAEVEIDTYPGRTWPAVVTSISQATQAEFSVLPAQNATGNWVKVVQRIPVRIAIQTEPGDPPLRAGMSTYVEIDTGEQRSLEGAVGHALAWLSGAAQTATAKAGSPAPDDSSE